MKTGIARQRKILAQSYPALAAYGNIHVDKFRKQLRNLSTLQLAGKMTS